MKDDEIKWAARVAHVREVSLLGTADLGYWAGRLKREDLVPDDRDGRAQVMIVAAALRWRGVRFRELSVSVLVRAGAGDAERKGAYLPQAWSSSRFLATCERVFFSTPYGYGDVRVSIAGPASIQLGQGGEIAFAAEMHGDGSAGGGRREPSRAAEGGWSGPVFLPGTKSAQNDLRKLFFAKATGLTETHPFCSGTDTLTIRPRRDGDTLVALVESHFSPTEWAIRPDATHAKSKTYRVPRAARLYSAPGTQYSVPPYAALL
jgi:hypothetical protein